MSAVVEAARRRAPAKRRARPAPRRSGAWSEAHVARLFWRAGFGATPAETAHWAARGRDATLAWVLDGGRAPLPAIPPPSVDGKALDPVNEWGHDVLWWLDRMARTPRPLVEKLTLMWHDHFATSDQDTPLMLAQNRLLRSRALGPFPQLLRGVTLDPAMQLFLSLSDSDKQSPNENYARELMELFTLGSGYTERDIREAARALTGFQSSWRRDGFAGISYKRDRHDAGMKRIYGRRGRFGWQDVLDLVTAHPAHAPFLVTKLWSWFVTEPPARATVRSLVGVYRGSRLRIKPVVAAILAHPALYRNLDAPDMVKSPVVLVAGALRATGTGIRTMAPEWMAAEMGQRLFRPPSVAGWKWGPAWMSSNSMRARFDWANQLLREGNPAAVAKGSTQPTASPEAALDAALAATGRPWIGAGTRAQLLDLAAHFFDDIKPTARPERRVERADMLQRSLRHLLLAGPDAQLH
jgi:uncharacterized protein (DUF1800 family)